VTWLIIAGRFLAKEPVLCWQYVAVCCSMSQGAAVCCRVLHCVAVCCVSLRYRNSGIFVGSH